MDDVHADAGAAGTGFDHQRQIVAQLLKRGVFGLGDQRGSPGSRDTGHLEDLLGGQLVHGKRTAKGIRACVADPQDIKGGLQFAVLPHRAVEAHEGNIRHAAQFDHIGAQIAVRLIRAGEAQGLKVGRGGLDAFRDLKTAVGKVENLLQIFRVAWIAKEYIQKEGSVPPRS